MKYKTKKLILKYSQVQRVVSWLKHVHVGGKAKVSLYKVLKIFMYNMKKDDLLDKANGVAFNFILAIFPTIIFLFTLIPYISEWVPEVNKESILAFLASLMPPSIYDSVATTIEDIVGNSRGGLYLATNGMVALMRAFNACYRTVENRGFFKMRLIATGLTLNLAFALFLAVILLIVGQLVLDYILGHLQEFHWLNLDNYTVYMILALRFIVIFLVFFFSISSIYYFAPAVHYGWRFFSFGSILSTLGIMSVSYGFSYYVTNFGSYNKVYGSIGALIALMVWVQLVTIVLLFGYEINASIHAAKTKELLWKARHTKKR
jgi:membrane protein